MGPGCCQCPAPGTFVAVGWHELGEDQGDDGSEEREGSADDGDVAFCCGPVGCADVAVWGGCQWIYSIYLGRRGWWWNYKMCQWRWQLDADWKDGGHWL